MLIRTSRLKNFQMRALDGEIGRARDFLFDDSSWKVRYMVSNTGKWLFGQQVLITPQLLQTPDLPDEKIPLKITKEELEKAPSIDEDQSVSRQYEAAYADYFSHSCYWVGGSSLGAAINSDKRAPVKEEASESKVENDKHLRSVEEVIGYRVDADC